MKRLSTLRALLGHGFGLGLGVGLAGAAAAAPSAATLADLRWSKRVIVAFEPGDAQGLEVLGRSLAERRCELEDRDLVVYAVDAEDVKTLTTATPRLAGETADSLRRRLAPRSDGFSMLLIGKDGGLKARAVDPGALQAFFDAIDRMPMRRQEMRQQPEEC